MKIIDASALLPGAQIATEVLHAIKQRGELCEVTRVVAPGRRTTPLGVPLQKAMARGKTLVHWDLKKRPFEPKWLALVRSADALIHGFLPEAAKRLGLDTRSLHAINPHLVVLVISAFPKGHPSYGRPAHDLNIQGLAGLITGFPALPWAHWSVVHRGTLDLLAALQTRSKPRKIALHVNIWDCLRKWGQLQSPMLQGKLACYQLYETKDHKWFSVAAVEPRLWKLFCETMELNPQASRRAIALTFRSRTWRHWRTVFKKTPCCVEPVIT